MAAHRERRENVRALGEDDGLMRWGEGNNETRISSEARFK